MKNSRRHQAYGLRYSIRREGPEDSYLGILSQSNIMINNTTAFRVRLSASQRAQAHCRTTGPPVPAAKNPPRPKNYIRTISVPHIHTSTQETIHLDLATHSFPYLLTQSLSCTLTHSLRTFAKIQLTNGPSWILREVTGRLVKFLSYRLYIYIYITYPFHHFGPLNLHPYEPTTIAYKVLY